MTIRHPLHSILCLSMIHQLVSTLTIHLSVHTVPWAHQHGCVHNATAKWTCFLLFSNFFFVWNAGGWCETFNWIPFWIRSLPKHWYGTQKWQITVAAALFYVIHSVTTQYHFPPSQSLLCKSVSGYKMQVFLWHHTFLSYLLECWHIAEKKLGFVTFADKHFGHKHCLIL